jgi:hypothetical protein
MLEGIRKTALEKHCASGSREVAAEALSVDAVKINDPFGNEGTYHIIAPEHAHEGTPMDRIKIECFCETTNDMRTWNQLAVHNLREAQTEETFVWANKKQQQNLGRSFNGHSALPTLSQLEKEAKGILLAEGKPQGRGGDRAAAIQASPSFQSPRATASSESIQGVRDETPIKLGERASSRDGGTPSEASPRTQLAICGGANASAPLRRLPSSAASGTSDLFGVDSQEVAGQVTEQVELKNPGSESDRSDTAFAREFKILGATSADEITWNKLFVEINFNTLLMQPGSQKQQIYDIKRFGGRKSLVDSLKVRVIKLQGGITAASAVTVEDIKDQESTMEQRTEHYKTLTKCGCYFDKDYVFAVELHPSLIHIFVCA